MSFPSHVSQLLDNLREVFQLLEIHEKIAGVGRGRKYEVEALNKSAIIMTVACWEAFAEDLAEAGIRALLKDCKDHSVFPKSVLERVASKHAGPNVWKLAGDGWKSAMADNLKEVLSKTTGALNTPRTEQINDLFLKTIGLENVSKNWSWRGRSSKQSEVALDELVTLRCNIAHRVKHSESVLKKDVVSSIELVSRLSAKTCNRVRLFVHGRTGVYPWNLVSYRGVK